MKTMVVFGSSRSDGKTRKAIDQVFDWKKTSLVDLLKFNISYFDYLHQNIEDDFLGLAKEMESVDRLVLATPVYWYTMSAIMKNFLDRWSDLLTIRKEMGRRLRGKELFVVTVYGTSYPLSFEAPFEQMCEYMGMNYRGCLYFDGTQGDPVFDSNDPVYLTLKRVSSVSKFI